ncbi:MAG: YkgJ family cysteine cluster protein [Verrucomicrobiota bacterium]
MFSPAVEKQRRQLYAAAVEGMEERVETAATAEDMLAAVRWGMALVERAHDETPSKIRRTVACRAGCDHCCHTPVDVQAHEVFFAAEHIQLHFTPEQLAAVIALTAERRARHSTRGAAARERPWQPCALLGADGRCTIYAGRPEICRVHHTSDARACAAFVADPGVDIDAVYVPTLRARMFAVMIGLDEAIEAAGYDDRSYDFNSALHEALTNSLCRVLWMRRMPAFPDACLSEPETDAGTPM